MMQPIIGAVATDTLSIPTGNPSIVGIVSAVLTACIFPFVLYFFKKNERLHEQTQTKVSEHAVTLGLHEYRLISLEEWRRLSSGATPPAASPPQNVTVNN